MATGTGRRAPRNHVTEIEQIRDYGLRVVYGNWAVLKNHPKFKAEFARQRLKWVAYIGGKRESRRLLGDVILRQQDIVEARPFPDASVTTTWTIDLHYPKETLCACEAFRSEARHIKIKPYPIPYRCLYSRNIENLMMAGRNISVTHVALGTVRVMRTTGMMGEVVGMAASLCTKHAATPRGVYEKHLDELKALMQRGVGKPDFAAMIQPVPLTAKFSDPDYYIWCGTLVKGDDAKYHLFYSRWPRKLGFQAWVTHSEIAHAVGDTPLGPFKHRDVALPPRGKEFWDGLCTHNPTVNKFGGKYCLYYMGNTGDGVPMKGLNWTHRNNQRIGVAVADSPNGPWTRLDRPVVDVSPDSDAPDALMTSNPAICERPGGGYLILYKAVGKQGKPPFGGPVVHLTATADSLTGPITKQMRPTFTAPGAAFPGRRSIPLVRQIGQPVLCDCEGPEWALHPAARPVAHPVGIPGWLRLEARRPSHGDDNRDPLGRRPKTSGGVFGTPATVLRERPTRRAPVCRRRGRQAGPLLQHSNPVAPRP